MSNSSATDGEIAVTEAIFNSISKGNPDYILDFSDDGNSIFLTNTADDSCYTITVHQDE